MSNSIKDYKSEMDNVKISLSFIKRTELLMNESPSVIIKQKPVISWRKLTGISVLTAACLLLVFTFGIRDKWNREEGSGIETVIRDTAASVPVTEIYNIGTDTAEVELIIESDDKAFAGFNPDSIKPFSVEASYDEAAVPTEKAPDTDGTAKSETTSASVTAEQAVTLPPASERTPADSIQPETRKLTLPAVTERPVPPSGTQNPAVTAVTEITVMPSGINSTVSSEIPEIEITDEYDENVLTEEIAGDEGLMPTIGGSEESPVVPVNLYSIDFGNTVSELNSFGIINGLDSGAVLSKADAEAISLAVANICGNSPAAENVRFKSVFNMRIANAATDRAYFDIYLTDSQSIVITRHDLKGQQRTTYMLSSENYAIIEELMFLQFGSQSDYEAYSSLKSGK